jgi:sugar phosphate isomerase/epimerase
MRASTFSRREFIERSSLAAAALALTPGSPAGLVEARQAGPPAHAGHKQRWKIIAFSKPFTNLSFDDTADLVADVGWDGIECPVRKSATHILPERVEEDLPKMVEALKKRGREVALITTDITGVDRSAEQVLRTAARLGIRRYRLGSIRYVADKSITDQLDEIKPRLRDLAQLNKTVGIQGGIQNHSGQDYFGAPVWDAFDVIRSLPPADIGIAFDIGHATLEGGLSWPVQARLAEPRYSLVYVKDFRWEKQEKGWRPVWCPLGQGMIAGPRFFTTLAKSRYDGPVCQHHEYEMGKTSAEMVRHFKRDLETLRAWLKDAA